MNKEDIKKEIRRLNKKVLDIQLKNSTYKELREGLKLARQTYQELVE